MYSLNFCFLLREGCTMYAVLIILKLTILPRCPQCWEKRCVPLLSCKWLPLHCRFPHRLLSRPPSLLGYSVDTTTWGRLRNRVLPVGSRQCFPAVICTVQMYLAPDNAYTTLVSIFI